MDVFGNLEIVVSTADVANVARLEGVSAKEFHRETDVNVFRTFSTAFEAMPRLRKSGGTIVFLNRIAEKHGFPKVSIYAANE